MFKFLPAIVFVLISCTNDNNVLVKVNGKTITENDLVVYAEAQGISLDELSEQQKSEKIEELVTKSVITYEVERLKTTEDDLFSFFEQLKTRDIPNKELEQFLDEELKGGKDLKGESRKNILEHMRNKQFDQAKEKYIAELKKRSTIKYTK